MADKEKRAKALKILAEMRKKVDKDTYDKMKERFRQKFGPLEGAKGAQERGKKLLTPKKTSEVEPRMRIPGDREVYDTKTPQKITSGDEFKKRMAKRNMLKELAKKAGKVAKKGLKAIPVIGGIASAVSSGDLMAATPIGESERLGPREGTLGAQLEDPSISREARMKVIQELRRRRGE